MSELLTLRECEAVSGIRARVWREMARAGKVASERRPPLAQILVPVEEVARVVVCDGKRKPGRPRVLPRGGA